MSKPIRDSKGRFAKTGTKPVKNRPVNRPGDGLAPNMGKPVIRRDALFAARVFSASGRHVFYQPDEAVRYSREEAEKMLLDLSITAPLFERMTAVALLKWHLDPEDADDPAEEAMATEVTRILECTPRFLNYRMALLYGTFWGRAACMNTFNYDFHKGKSFLRVTDWFPVHGDSLVFDINNTVGLRVGFADADLYNLIGELEITPEGRTLWLDRYQRSFLTLYRQWQEAGVYEDVHTAGVMMGTGLRSKLFYTWRMKNDVLGYVLTHFERLGSGFQVWTFEQGDADQQAAVFDAVKAQSHGQAIVLPMPRDAQQRGPSVTHTEVPASSTNFMLQVLKDYFDDKMRAFIVGQSLSSGTATTGLGSGVSELHRETKDNLIRSDAISLQECLTDELVMPLVRFNKPYYPDWPDCKLKFVFELEEVNVKEQLDAAKALHEIGVQVDHDSLRDVAGMRAPQEGAQDQSTTLTDRVGDILSDAAVNGQVVVSPAPSAQLAKVADLIWSNYP